MQGVGFNLLGEVVNHYYDLSLLPCDNGKSLNRSMPHWPNNQTHPIPVNFVGHYKNVHQLSRKFNVVRTFLTLKASLVSEKYIVVEDTI